MSELNAFRIFTPFTILLTPDIVGEGKPDVGGVVRSLEPEAEAEADTDADNGELLLGGENATRIERDCLLPSFRDDGILVFIGIGSRSM